MIAMIGLQDIVEKIKAHGCKQSERTPANYPVD
jgi:hypothetical protein